MPGEKPKVRVYVNVELQLGLYVGSAVNKLRATLTLPDYPGLARHAAIRAYADKVLEPYMGRNGNGKPHHELDVTTSSNEEQAVFEAVEPAGQGVLDLKFDEIILAMKKERGLPVRDIPLRQEDLPVLRHSGQDGSYEITLGPKHTLLILYA